MSRDVQVWSQICGVIQESGGCSWESVGHDRVLVTNEAKLIRSPYQDTTEAFQPAKTSSWMECVHQAAMKRLFKRPNLLLTSRMEWLHWIMSSSFLLKQPHNKLSQPLTCAWDDQPLLIVFNSTRPANFIDPTAEHMRKKRQKRATNKSALMWLTSANRRLRNSWWLAEGDFPHSWFISAIIQ